MAKTFQFTITEECKKLGMNSAQTDFWSEIYFNRSRRRRAIQISCPMFTVAKIERQKFENLHLDFEDCYKLSGESHFQQLMPYNKRSIIVVNIY